ncbi:homoserine kinase [Piscirickettsia salmonis]|uniref:diphosphomevalonate decarboxylase n=1 Tax=Piscirickettsia salmonis TaxID=1238 RepID=A0A1L6T9R9_PISSA|nr:diphosphomevalonate decarboxylase [Piscirickettsia salmonis]ALB21907.1 diphosphomevalonate decarboxylase [Piscirickettsia salmonis]ALT18201.1 diphosphomevalonate decarboxylase [Piscirickettsia salmonis LF-89 = ATCC VR-1361]ALY02079.1 diphosphomevalonate decarboxylase [Piscirickettsia salmonis]AMA41592.1 diphosphomevalonate decarboxylase [Piscirickettsia salmonis]AOS34075.1 diphosphomevalonate decarboxylase [Piscirickettsia salmonis]
MITKQDYIRSLLLNNHNQIQDTGHAFAPSNIALVKYWGKRQTELNLPLTDSLSISLAHLGARTLIKEKAQEKIHSNKNQDTFILNDQTVDLTHAFSKRLTAMLDLFRPTPHTTYHVNTTSNIPIAAGLASSACGFAALILALNNLYHWQLSDQILSILARIGSGSAARSIFHGFVHWRTGILDDGRDSYAYRLNQTWPELCIGLVIFEHGEKIMSSRAGMQHTIATSPLYASWPKTVENDLEHIQTAITQYDFTALGQIAEGNALAMHATMHSARPALMYSTAETISAMQTIWQLRQDGLEVYFTQDAGPNLKLLFQQKDKNIIQDYFPNITIIQPFKDITE